MADSRERRSLRERGVTRKILGFKLVYLCDDLRWVYDESARGFVSYDQEVRGKGLRVILYRL